MKEIKKRLKTILQKKDNHPIQYHIEGVDHHQKTCCIYGWAVDLSDSKPVLFSVVGSPEDIRLVRTERPDVNQIFNLPDHLRCGFILTVTVNDAANIKQIKIRLRSHEGHERMIIPDLTGHRYLSRSNRVQYPIWIKNHEPMSCSPEMRQAMEDWPYQPLISIVMPVYNVEEKFLKDCIRSVQEQWYPHWELCITDDASDLPYIKPYLTALMAEDDRIHCCFRTENGHISKASNDALALASGEFIALLDNDDLLAPFALYDVVEKLNQEPDLDFIYSDEDKITENGLRKDPFFKPEWSPDTLMGQNYICHFTVIRKTLMEKAGGFEPGLEGAQDHDLFLKCTELTRRIGHIPAILYHWRESDTSTAKNPGSKNYASVAGCHAVQNALNRRHLVGKVAPGILDHTYIVDYLPMRKDMVSIIIPTKDHVEDLVQCIESVIQKAGYPHWEIIIVDNGSEEEATQVCFNHYGAVLKDRFRVLPLNVPFNYSQLNNAAARIAKGDYLMLMNNDIEMLTDGWMGKMLGYAQQEHIGAVGAKLYYPDNSIQHAGVVLGIGGVAAHSHKYFPRNAAGYFSRLMIPSNYAGVTAACLMVSKEKYFEVNGLDEINLSIAFNDVDFNLELLKHGYYNICLSQVEGYHYESKSRGQEDTRVKRKRFQNEVLYMLDKWEDQLNHDPFYSPHLSLKEENFSIRLSF